MNIYFNNTHIEINPVDESYRYRSIMGENAITLMFSLPEFQEIPIGAYCDFEGQQYTLETPANVVKKNSRHFDYTLILEAPQAKLKKYKIRNIVDKRLKFNLTAKPEEHIQQLIHNLNLRDSGWTVGECIEATEKLVSYNHTFCLDALNMIANEFQTEWEINQKEIRLRKVEHNTENPLPLSYGRGNGFKSGISRLNNNKKAVEILYIQGGERNIDLSKYGTSELLLPKSQQIEYQGRLYETDSDGYYVKRADKQIQSGEEDSLDLSNIYPSREGTVSGIVVVSAEGNLYDFIDSSIPENLNYENCLIAGRTMTVIFQTGILAGREFEVNYKHPSRKFEIVPQEIDGVSMPNETFKPAIGDKYAVFNIMMPEAYICDNATQTGASWDMLREAVKYLHENENPGFNFTGELDGIWSKKQWLNVGGKIILGGHVLFTDDQFQTEPVLIRIIGIRDYINNPYSPIIELSNTTVASSFSSEIKKIDAKEVLTNEQHQNALQFTRRSFRSAQETIKMLESSMLGYSESIRPITVQTMALLVGDESLQFRFVDSKSAPVKVSHLVVWNDATKILTAEEGIVQHMTFGIEKIKPARQVADYKFWDVAEFNSPPLTDVDKAYYFYIKASKTTQEATFYLSETSFEQNPTGDYYYFLMGILNSEVDNVREFASLYGFSEVAPGRITTDVVATDTLLANEAKLADWIIRNGKISSAGITDNIPWAELDGVNGLITFIKGAISAYMGIQNNIPGLKLVNGNNSLETYLSTNANDYSSIGWRFKRASLDNRIDINIDDLSSYIIFREGGNNVLEIGSRGMEVLRAFTDIFKTNNSFSGILIKPSGDFTSKFVAGIYVDMSNITQFQTKYAAYYKGNLHVDGNITYTGSLTKV